MLVFNFIAFCSHSLPWAGCFSIYITFSLNLLCYIKCIKLNLVQVLYEACFESNELDRLMRSKGGITVKF